jgi:hypothetical protein
MRRGARQTSATARSDGVRVESLRAEAQLQPSLTNA